jgi:transcriptional regulator with XRE-family HTH domain
VNGDDFGVRVRQVRDGARLSQIRLAHRAGIGRSWLQSIESGRVKPSLEHALALFDVLCREVKDLSAEWFLCGLEPADPCRVDGVVNRREFNLRAAATILSTALPSPMMNLDLERLAAPTLDASVVTELESLTAHFARLRPMLSPREWLYMGEAHFASLRARADQATGGDDLSRRFLSLVAGQSALCAWVCLMAERRHDARAYLDYGESVGREINDANSLALLLMLRADLLSAVPTGGQEGFPGLAREALEEALTYTSPGTPVSLRAPVLLRIAEEYAYAGHEALALQYLLRGDDAAATGRVGPHVLRPVWTHDHVFPSFRGSCLQLLGRAQEAVDELTPLIDTRFPWHRPLLLADLGAAHAQLHDLDATFEALDAAIKLVGQYGYAGAGRRIAGVRVRHLTQWDDEPAVNRLDKRLAAIL